MTVDLETYDWTTCEYGQYRIEKTRWNMYRSIDKEGNALVIGMTEEAVHTMTPVHMFANSPGYDGSHDSVTYNNTKHVDL